MGITQFDEMLLDLAYQTFALKTAYFDRLGQPQWSEAGIENWVQVELGMALMIRDIPVLIKGKVGRHCDLIIGETDKFKGVEVELGASTKGSISSFKERFKRHPNTELYLFVSKTDDSLINKLNSYFSKQNYVEKHRMLNAEWMVMIVKRLRKDMGTIDRNTS